MRRNLFLSLLIATCLVGIPALADSFFSTGSPDGRMAMASQPSSSGKTEIEAADDFILSQSTTLDGATFYGLLPSGTPLGDVNQVVVEIYRVFPADSTTPPDGHVLTRMNSPSDVAFASRDSAFSTLTFTATVVSANFTAANSVVNGIHPSPNQTTGGEGSVTGEEVLFAAAFNNLTLPAGHYFFVPQVGLTGSGNFLWLSADGPPQFTGDLQTWIRNADLDPDWSRVGTDIVGGGTSAPKFDAAFSLQAVPEPSSLLLLGTGLLGAVGAARRKLSG